MESIWQRLKSTIILMSAGAIYALAIKYFVIPAHIIVTGTEGISLSISYFLEKYWVFVVLFALCQVGLILFSTLTLGIKFTLRTVYAVATTLILLAILPEFNLVHSNPENEKLILVLFGGLLAGVGKAIALRQGGSVGDEDIISAFFAQRYAIPIGRVVAIAGFVTTSVGLALVYLKTHDLGAVVNTLMYLAIYIFVCRETLDALFRHFDLCRMVIITPSPDIAIGILSDFSARRTYTLQTVSGGYSKAEHAMLTVLVTAAELPKLLRLFKAHQLKGFIYYHNIEGVLGQYHYDPIAGH